jgi:hypothetical protein
MEQRDDELVKNLRFFEAELDSLDVDSIVDSLPQELQDLFHAHLGPLFLDPKDITVGMLQEHMAQTQLLGLQNSISFSKWFNKYKQGLDALPSPNAIVSRNDCIWTLYWRKSLLRRLPDRLMTQVPDSEAAVQIMTDVIRVHFTGRAGLNELLDKATHRLLAMNEISGTFSRNLDLIPDTA